MQALNRHGENIKELQRDNNAVVESYVGLVPEELDDLAPEERHQVYKMLRLQVMWTPDGFIGNMFRTLGKHVPPPPGIKPPPYGAPRSGCRSSLVRE